MSKDLRWMDPGTPRELWKRHECGRLTLSWALAGGILAGGFLILSVAITGVASSSAAPTASLILFGLGALAGLVHGGILAYLSRNPERTRRDALLSLALAGGLLLLVAPLAWFVALHLALTLPFWQRGFFAMAGVSLSWIVGTGLCLWAALEGWRGLKRAFLRWPERRLGSLLLTGILAILMLGFFLESPTLWGTDIQVKGVGALVLALGATAWIAFPVVLAVLHGLHRVFGDALVADGDSTIDSPQPGV